MVTAEVRNIVLRRDGFRCMAPVLDPTQVGKCRDVFGTPQIGIFSSAPGPHYLQMSHTKSEGEQSMSKKAPNDPEHLITLCPWHHTGTEAGSNWEARNRALIRRHLGIDNG